MKSGLWLIGGLWLTQMWQAYGGGDRISGDVEIRDPSDYRIKIDAVPPTVRFISEQRKDLRLLFCNSESLQAREARSVCVVDDYATFQEVKCEPGDTVGAILARSRPNIDRFSLWPLRIVRKDSIEQTPYENYTEKEERVFLAEEMRPGDVLVILVVRCNYR